MIIRAIEILDRHTFIPALAILVAEDSPAQRYLLRRTGYLTPTIILMRLSDQRATSDPHEWNDRTHRTAHLRLQELVNSTAGFAVSVRDGDVFDVEFLLGETTVPKPSERERDL